MKSLFIPLKTEYYEGFKARRKKMEFRVYGPRWNEEVCQVGRRVRLRKGYSGEEIFGTITRFRKATTADLAEDVQADLRACYGPDVKNKAIACIEIEIDT